MGENIDYWGKITGFRKDEKQEIQNVCSEFQEAEITRVTDEEIEFKVDGGRVFGMTCEETIKEHFGSLAIKKSHIKIEIYCTYVDCSPVEVITIENNKTLAVFNS